MVVDGFAIGIINGASRAWGLLSLTPNSPLRPAVARMVDWSGCKCQQQDWWREGAKIVPYGAKDVAKCSQKVQAPPDLSSSTIDIGAPPVLEVAAAEASAPPVPSVLSVEDTKSVDNA